MEKALENLSKEDLLKVISSRDEKIDYLESQLAMYKRMQFGQKRELAQYKKIVAELTLQNTVLKDVIEKKL